MSEQPTPATSLDNLKKEAKRWLKALRASDPEARARLKRAYPKAPSEPGLRDIQHALALEHSLTNWNALKRLHSASAARTSQQHYEEMAEALLDAYRTGTPAAMERHWKHTWHRRAWKGMRTYVLLDLGRRPAEANHDADISLEDARFLVAREYGFENWQALTEYTSLPTGQGAIAAKPVTFFSMDEAGARQTVTHAREWNTVIGVMREKRIPGLDAQGQMTDVLLDTISRLDHVTSLDLHGSERISDDGLRCLARMPHLQRLNLSRTGITDRGLEVLRELKELRTINLAWTGITDAGASHLSQCEHLEDVDLSATHTGDGAIKALTGKSGLSRFFSGLDVTDAGLPLLHAFPVFKTWRGGAVQMALLSADAGPNHLGLCGSITDAGLASLARLDGLFALNLDDSSLSITGSGLAPLTTLSHLGRLAFDATDEAMPYIAALPHLRFLICQDTETGDDGWVALSRSQSIETIWGRRCWNLQSRGFTALSEMPALRSLSVSCKNVDDTGLSALPHFPSLQELMPIDVPDEGYRHIAGCERLESLILMYCRDTTDAAAEHISSLRRLKRYFASYNLITDRTPEILSGISSLEQVEFISCAGLTNQGIAALARLPHLRELRVSGMTNVTPDVASAFPSTIHVEYDR